MPNIIGFYVFSTARGGLWLSDDEKSWQRSFDGAAEFTSAELARDIAKRENPTGSMDMIYIMGAVESE